MADLRKLKDKAAELAAKGKVERAAEVFREILRADPRDVASRQKLAEVLRRDGQVAAAVAAYVEVAERFARDGLLIKAIAICKTVLELDPSHDLTQHRLAELYARKSALDGTRAPGRPEGRRAVATAARAAPDEEPTEVERGVALTLEEPRAETTGLARIVAAAERAVEAGVEDPIEVDVEQVDELPAELMVWDPPAAAEPEVEIELEPEPAAEAATDARLPHVPLFSDLGHDAFVALTEGLSVRRIAPGDPVIAEGEPGNTFYVVATGRLRVEKRDEQGEPVLLAHLGEGDFFGEMALLSGAPRAATVLAETAGELLELRAEVLQRLASEHPHVAGSLRRFFRQRLLANALAISPLFQPLGREDRRQVMEQFRERAVAAGELVVREGEPADGLYLLLEGTADVTHRKDGVEVLVGQLREGDLFGEISCLRKTGATASVRIRRPGTLLRLPRPAFDALVMTYPTVLELVSQLSDERTDALDAILAGSATYTEHGLVLT